MKTIVRMKFGSHLYGTNTSTSDTDYKGVFIPDTKDILLGRIPKSINNSTGQQNEKNLPGDVDEEMYSLHYFIQLACKGETVALDMLHAPLDFVDEYTDTWKYLVENRQKLYTKNLKAFVGYARRQAAKYGVKGSRLNAAKDVITILLNAPCRFNISYQSRLSEIWESLPIGEHLRFVEDSPNGTRQYEVCGRILQETVSVEYALNQVQIFYDRYGERAKLAAENLGVDFKAVSHALRAAYQVKELLENNTITFPRPEAAFLIDVKSGKLHYKNEIEPILDKLIIEVEELSIKSDLPEKADTKFWDDFIIGAVNDSMFRRQLNCFYFKEGEFDFSDHKCMYNPPSIEGFPLVKRDDFCRHLTEAKRFKNLKK